MKLRKRNYKKATASEWNSLGSVSHSLDLIRILTLPIID